MPLEKKIIGGYAIALTLLLVIGVVSFRSLGRLEEKAYWIKHTQEVLTGIASLLSTLTDAETGQRGYTITGDEAFLEPCREAMANASAEFLQLRKLTADNPRQQARLAMLEPLITARLAEAQTVMELRRAQGFEAARRETALRKGKQIHDRIRAVVAGMKQEESGLQRQRDEKARAATRFAQGVILCGSLLALALVSLALGIIRRDFSARRRVEAALQEAHDDLDRRVAERTRALSEANGLLRKSEALYHDLVETSQDLIWQCDAEGRYTYLNPAWEDVFGYTVGEMLGRPFTDFQTPVNAGRDRQEFARLMQGNVVKGLESILRRKDGQELHLVFNAKFLRDKSGNIAGTRGTAYDITERKRAEAQAEAARAQLSLVFERVTDAFVALDQDWRYTYVNRRAGEIFGRRPEDLIGKHIWTEFPEGVGQPFHRAYERAMAEQESLCFEDYYPPYDRWFENILYPSPNGLSIYFHDITERKRAEALVKGHNQVLEMIAAGSSLPDTLATLVRLLEAQAPGMLGSILLLDTDGVHLRHGAAPSLPEDYVAAVDGRPIGPCAGSCGTAAYRKEAVFVEDIATDPLWASYQAAALPHGLRACWSTPIFNAEQQVLGTFAMYYRQPSLPQPHHRQLVKLATHTAAIAISRHRAEAALCASETLFREIFYRAGVGKIQAEPATGRLLRVNPAFCAFTGYTEVELAGTTFAELTFPEDRQADQAFYSRLLRREIPAFEREKRYVRKDGAVVWGSVSVTLLFDQAGCASLATAVIQDITKRKRAEAALQESEARLRSVFEQAYDGIFIISAENRYLDANARGLELLGYPRDELLQMGVADVLAPHEVARLAVEPPRMMSGTPHLAEWDHVRKGGSSFPGEVSARKLNNQSYLAIVRDLTTRRQAEAALRESEAKFRALAETAAAGIFVFQGARFRFINPAVQRLTGYAEEELLALNFWDVAHPDHRDLVRERGLARQRGEAVPNRYEFKLLTKSGEERWVDFTAGAITFEGQPAGLGTVFDITERKQAQAERDRLFNHSLDLLCVAGFDGFFKQLNPAWRNNLGWTAEELRAKPWLDFVHPDDREATRDAGEQLARGEVVRSFENRYRCKDGSYLWLSWNAFPLAGARTIFAVVRDITKGRQAEAALRESEERLRLFIEHAPAEAFSLEPERATGIFRIFQELLTNVARHAAATRVVVTLHQAVDGLTLEVKDNGRGIRQEELDDSGSLGVLGMSERASLMDGKIEIHGQSGEGTTATLTIPAKPLHQ